MALQPITTKQLKHPLISCVSAYNAVDQEAIQPSQCVNYNLQSLYAWCVDGLNGIDNRITRIHDSGDDFRDNFHQLAQDAPEEFCKIALWLGKYMFNKDRNIAHNAELMLEIKADEKVILKLKEQWYKYYEFEEKKYHQYFDTYTLTIEGISRFLEDGGSDLEFKGWFPLDTFLPAFAKNPQENFKPFNSEDISLNLPF